MIDGLFEKLQEAQGKIEETKKQLEAILIDESTEGVSVRVSANQTVKDISIPQKLIDEGDKEQIEDLLVITLTKALQRAKKTEERQMQANAQNMLGGLNF